MRDEHVLTPESIESLTLLQLEFGAEHEQLLAGREARARRRAGVAARFLRERSGVRAGRLARAAGAGRPRRPPRRDHGGRPSRARTY